MVLNNLSLRVDKSEFISIMGPSGSGKTTLLNILGGLDIQDSGNYYFQEEKVLSTNGRLLRREHISIIPQNYLLINQISAFDNIALPLKIRKYINIEKEVLSIAERLEIKDLLNKKPPKLSSGERQRISVARAVITKPRFLLADEPTSALDSRLSENLIGIFKEMLNEGTSIVMVTHNITIADMSTSKLCLNNGVLSVVGS